MNFLKRFLIITLILLAILYGGRSIIKTYVGEDALNIAHGIFLQAIGKEVPDNAQKTDYFTPVSTTIELDESIKPFREIGEKLGDAAKGNNFVIPRGFSVFDANGDGRLDLYFPHSGRPTSKLNDADGVLQPDQAVPAKPSALFLNMGNDAQGDPIYKTVEELIKAQSNARFVREELLPENKYQPRNSVEEDPHGIGRVSFGSCAADFNGDGRIDILALGSHYGMPHVDLSLGVTIFPPSENIGRKKSNIKSIKTTLPPFLAGDMKDGIYQTVTFGGEPEPEGRNSLYLNMGDQDKDGIPEWKDVSVETGLGSTNWNSGSAAVGDIDRDGDLDIYITNFIDPDFWGFGIKDFAGHPNTLWINQLAETGKLSFKEQAKAYGVAGLHIEENLPSSHWDREKGALSDNSKQTYKGEQVGKRADHSWSARFVDFTQDGWPDLLVANDVGNRMRAYINEGGKSFKIMEQFHDAYWNGAWMGIASGDLNGDLTEEIMLANFGTQAVTIRNNALVADDPSELSIAALLLLNYLEGKAQAHHAALKYVPNEGFKEITTELKVAYSPYTAPDIVHKPNAAIEAERLYEKYQYGKTITGMEFAWQQLFYDIDNDSDLDIYSLGALSRGNDDFFGEFTSSPGRLLVNQSPESGYQFVDKTLEYQAFDISQMEYENNPPRRAAPGTNWHKRDYIYLQDLDSYAEMGLEASKRSRIKDIFRMHEFANTSLNADLNNDGFQDMVVIHGGGGNSNLPSARNLKINVMGRKMAMPPPNKVIKAPTNFEEGPTFMYMNSGAPAGSTGNWVKIALNDPTGYNPFGIGAKVIANGKIMRKLHIGGQYRSSIQESIHIGLGDEELHSLEIHWASGDQRPELIRFDTPKKNTVVEITRGMGK